MKNKLLYVKKVLICLVVLVFFSDHLFAEANNISMQGENYISVHNSNFPAKLIWEQLSNDTYSAGEFPIESYWFVTPTDAHVIVHLSTGGSSIFIELSKKKSIYHFPADYSNKEGGGNDFSLYAIDNNGTNLELSSAKNALLTIQVEQLDAIHLKLNISGTVSITRLSQNATIDGKISLQKESAALGHLADTYSGCDNIIYNRLSPTSDLGQWRSPAQCEVSFYQQLFSNIKGVFEPVYSSLTSKGWMVQQPQYKPLARINKMHDQNNDYFQPDPAYKTTANADPQKGEYHDYLQRVLNFAQSGASFTDAAQMAKYQALSKEGEGRYAVTLKLVINKQVEISTNLDFSKAVINKINDGLYIVSGIAGDYNNGAGTYIFVGNWDDGPKWEGSRFSMESRFAMDGKKLSVQAFYINIGCNDQLAAIIVKNIDLNKLGQLLQVKP